MGITEQLIDIKTQQKQCDEHQLKCEGCHKPVDQTNMVSTGIRVWKYWHKECFKKKYG